MTEQNIHNLTNAILLQAIKDFINGSKKQRTIILKDLRSSRMDLITNGASIIVAEQLELHPETIAARLRKHYESEGKPI